MYFLRKGDVDWLVAERMILRNRQWQLILTGAGPERRVYISENALKNDQEETPETVHGCFPVS
jgi:hypothetical protein